MTKATVFFISISLAAALALGILYFVFELSPVSVEATSSAPAVSNSSGTVQVLVQKGDGFYAISQLLFAKGLIRSASAFRFYSLLAGKAHRLQPGSYEFSAASSTVEIVSALARGPDPDIEVLITEGQTLHEIDTQLSSRGIVSPGALQDFSIAPLLVSYPFLKNARSLEGFLFPDTYRFYFDAPTSTTVKILLDNFATKALPILARNNKKIYDTLTIASILEKEVADSEDRLLVSGIIYKRLALGMALQIDATRVYSREHNDPAYDTYQRAGLPPGPIGNPGLDAISAALHPKSSGYLYYLSDPKTGKTYFSKTFEEHDNNRALYLRNKSGSY